MSETSIFAPLYEGKSNRFACAALTAVAHHPGACYNPLWVYGPSGTGKTAMLEAVSRKLRTHPSRPLILRIQAEQLVHDMIRAIEHRSIEDFHARLFEFQVIIVDHLDYLYDRFFTQIEVGQLLAKAADKGIQVMLASCRAPSELENLNKAFIDSCPWWLRCDISILEPEERLEIIRQMTQTRNLPVSGQMANRIAEAAWTPSRIRCILDYLTAQRELLQLDDADLSDALDHFLKQEVTT